MKNPTPPPATASQETAGLPQPRKMSVARAKWQESGGRAISAVKAASVLQQRKFDRQSTACSQQYVPTGQIRRARAAYAGLFLLMVTFWSSLLISAIFSLRINRDSCEYCPDDCTCRGSPPAWG